ncbi:MAG: hypothetical protein V1843_04560 [bacterium]
MIKKIFLLLLMLTMVFPTALMVAKEAPFDYEAALKGIKDVKAKEILKNMIEKYIVIFSDTEGEIKSFEAKMLLKADIKVPVGEKSKELKNVHFDVGLDISAKQPEKVRADMTGNFGDYKLYVNGEKMWLFFEKEKLYTFIDLKENKKEEGKDDKSDTVKSSETIEPGATESDKVVTDESTAATTSDTSSSPDDMADVDFSYKGITSTPLGDAHKLKVVSTEIKQSDGEVFLYVLDDKWDPYKIEAKAKEGEGYLIIDSLKFNDNIDDNVFNASTAGYTEVANEEAIFLLMGKFVKALGIDMNEM